MSKQTNVVNPISDQLMLTRRGRVWANCENQDWTALDATRYLIKDLERGGLRHVIETCVAMSGSHTATIDGRSTACETWHVVDPSGVLYSIGEEHGELFTDRRHGVPVHCLSMVRAYPDRVIVHVTPTKGY